MAKKKGDNKKKLLFFLALPFINVGYQILSPYLAETRKLRADAAKLNTQIKQVKLDALMYSEDWEKKTAAKEKELAALLPEQITPAEVLRYFATNFENEHSGVQFTSLIPAPPAASGFIADKENQRVKARASKVQIKAKMPPEHLLAYLEYVEKYPGLSRVSEVNFTSPTDGKNTLLDLELAVDLFLVPKEWLPKEPTKEDPSPQRDTAATTVNSGGFDWFETKTIENPQEEKEEAPPPEPKEVRPPKLHVSQFVGTSIVIGDELYEEGDTVQGWMIRKIEPKERAITLQRGKNQFKVVVK